MRVAQAAAAFDTMPCHDAYTGALAFHGQLALYDDNKRDSETAERRVISVAPTVSLPSRRVISAAGTRYIIGTAYPDWYRGSMTRIGYVCHEATSLSTVYTLAQLAANQAGLSAWSGRSWVKNQAFSEQSSHLAPQHHIHFAKTEVVADEQIVLFEGRYHVIRMWNYGPAGTIVALCDQLPDPVVENAQITGGTRDPVTATWSGSPTSVRVVRIRWQSLFRYAGFAAPKFAPEDLQLTIAKSVFTPIAGMKTVLSDGTYALQSVQDEGLVWLCRAARHV